MQIKTFVATWINGRRKAFEVLDSIVAEELGDDVTIHSVIDNSYGDNHTTSPGDNMVISRIVVFSPKTEKQ